MAKGKFSVGLCMRCGAKVPLLSLRRDGFNKGLLVCSDCYDMAEAPPAKPGDDVKLKYISPDPNTDRTPVTKLADAMGFVHYFGGGT